MTSWPALGFRTKKAVTVTLSRNILFLDLGFLDPSLLFLSFFFVVEY
jgi:hypothetical protein